jgi:hypothetical protein
MRGSNPPLHAYDILNVNMGNEMDTREDYKIINTHHLYDRLTGAHYGDVVVIEMLDENKKIYMGVGKSQHSALQDCINKIED